MNGEGQPILTPESGFDIYTLPIKGGDRSFLQSHEWEEIQKCDGRESYQLDFDGESLVYFKHNVPLGFYYFYSPRPSIKNSEAFLNSLAKIKKSGAIFFRVEPITEITIRNPQSAIRNAPNLQPKETILIDLAKTDEELLSSMHPKTRYNIRVAEKHGVTIERRVGSDAVEDFYELLSETSHRDRFYLHKKEHYENLLRFNSHEFSNELFFAVHEGRIAASLLVNFYKGKVTYLHGASHYGLRSLMAPYLLQWHLIREARLSGASLYDFGGIDEVRWPGVTRFKKGFGGERTIYPQAFDIVLRPQLYFLYRSARSIL